MTDKRRRYIRIQDRDSGFTSYIDPGRLQELVGSDLLPDLVGLNLSDAYMTPAEYKRMLHLERLLGLEDGDEENLSRDHKFVSRALKASHGERLKVIAAELEEVKIRVEALCASIEKLKEELK